MRSFLAVSLPGHIRDGIYNELSFLESKGVKRTSKENLHITVAFMGESVSANDKLFFSSIIEKISFTPFQISLGKTNAFPSKENPSILWIGLENGKKEMIDLRMKVYSVIRKAGFDIDEKFHPHITVARLRENFNHNFLQTFFKKDFSNIYSFKLDALVWYESISSQNGIEYREIFKKKIL